MSNSVNTIPHALPDTYKNWRGGQINSVVYHNIPLTGVTTALGGSTLQSGHQITANVTVTGATNTMVAVTNPAVYPGIVDWQAYVVAANTVQVVITNPTSANVTPTSTTYQVRVMP